MKTLYVNSFEDSKAVLLESCKAGDQSLELANLDEEDRQTLLALVDLVESYRCSRALGALFHAGYAHGLRMARRKLTAA
jgi:hypothetical protein